MYTKNEQGIVNNYASEPQLYYAEYPTQEQKNSYLLQGGAAVLFITAILLIAFGVS